MSIIDELHPADTADLLETLSGEERKRIIEILKHKFPADALPSMNVPILIDIIEYFEVSHLIQMLSKLDTDDITYVLEVCEDKLRNKILLKVLPLKV